MRGARLPLTLALAACTPTAGPGASTLGTHATQPPTARGVRAVDWLNHTYAIDGIGDVAVSGGSAELAIDRATHAQVPDGTGNAERVEIVVDPPVFADVDGNGQEDALVTLRIQRAPGRTATLTAYAVVAGAPPTVLGTIRGDGGIDGVRIDHRAILVERTATADGRVPIERWQWSGTDFAEDEAARVLTIRPVDANESSLEH